MILTRTLLFLLLSLFSVCGSLIYSVPSYAEAQAPQYTESQIVLDTDEQGNPIGYTYCAAGFAPGYQLPEDEDYNQFVMFDVTNEPQEVYNNGLSTSGEFPRYCNDVAMGQTYTFRGCIRNATDSNVELLCASDQGYEVPAEFPTEPSDGEQAYPSYGYMVAIQLLIFAGIGIVILITRAYTPKGRR